MAIRKIEAGRVITQPSTEFVGQYGTIFYDETLGDLRISDESTPGGRLLIFGGGGGDSPYVRITSNYQAVSLTKYIADTSGGSFNLTLPASPSIGDFIIVTDGANWHANPLTILHNGPRLEGIVQDLLVDLEGITVFLVYNGPTDGWQVTATLGLQGTMGYTGSAGIGYTGSAGTGSNYTLPVATTSTLGGIKVGANLSITLDGTLSALASGGGNLDGGYPGSIYGGIDPIDGGGV